jgi:hypothetical protein
VWLVPVAVAVGVAVAGGHRRRPATSARGPGARPAPSG